jgi:hypothetical protein
MKTPTYTYTTIDPPGSINTIADDINNKGDTVGYYFDSNGGAKPPCLTGHLAPSQLAGLLFASRERSRIGYYLPSPSGPWGCFGWICCCC